MFASYAFLLFVFFCGGPNKKTHLYNKNIPRTYVLRGSGAVKTRKSPKSLKP